MLRGERPREWAASLREKRNFSTFEVCILGNTHGRAKTRVLRQRFLKIISTICRPEDRPPHQFALDQPHATAQEVVLFHGIERYATILSCDLQRRSDFGRCAVFVAGEMKHDLWLSRRQHERSSFVCRSTSIIVTSLSEESSVIFKPPRSGTVGTHRGGRKKTDVRRR